MSSRFAPRICGPFLLGLLAMAGSGTRLVAAPPIQLEEATRTRCLEVLREGLAADEFWPAMHAAEGLTVAGYPAEVQRALEPKLGTETDSQRRCGLARELVRAGQLSRRQILLDILADENPHGHVHACESLYKVWEIGDGRLLREAFQAPPTSKKTLMAAAALARWGNRSALQHLRMAVRLPDEELARTAAWILARTGDARDLPSLRAGVERFAEPLTRAYFQHALAALGDPAGLQALAENLEHSDAAVRVYACEFAPDARAGSLQPRLEKRLADPVLDVRVRAAHALLELAQPAPLSPHEPFVRDLFPATEQNPRYSEGSVAVLRDGRLLYATTEFFGNGSDASAARIVGIESADQGQTWSERHVIQENIGRQNVMSVSLVRLAAPARYDAPLGFFYLVKNSPRDLRVNLRLSTDEGASFGEPIQVTTTPGYHVLNNDRVTVISGGRIVVPVATTTDVGQVNHFVCSCFLSDDGGRNWRPSRNQVDYPRRGAMEPEVIERQDGTLLMHFRTQLGHIAVSESKDRGETWGEPQPWPVRAPEAPSTLRRIPSTGDWLLIWNDTFVAGQSHGGKRTPLTAAVSRDEGGTWGPPRSLETDPHQTFAYTSVTFHRGRALLTYYVGDERTGRISSRFRSVPLSWFSSETEGP